MVRPELVGSTNVNARASGSRIRERPVVHDQSLGFLQAAADFSIHDGVIASIGGDSFTARGDVNVTIHHHHPSSLSSSLSSLNAPNETQEQDPAEEAYSRTPLPIQRSCDIYRRHLEAKGRGISLWIPAPSKNLPKEYQRNGIALGDVGILTSSGGFHFLFNVCLPKEHPINPRKMPDGFEPLSRDVIHSLDISVQRELLENSYLASTSVSRVRVRPKGGSTGLVFESSEHDGAILTMPVGAKSEDLTNIKRFRKYVTANMASWYKYAYHDRDFEIRNGDLRVVTGTDKTSAWGMATFSNSGQGCSSTRQDPVSPLTGCEPKFQLEFGPIENGEGPSDRQARRYGWEYSGVAEVRAGPDAREIRELREGTTEDDGDVVYENQCLFIRTMNTTLPERIWEQLGIDEEEEVDFGYDYGYHSVNGDTPGSSSSSSSSSGQNNNTSGGSKSGGSSMSPTTRNQLTSTSTRMNGTISVGRSMYAGSPSIALAEHPSNAINQLLLQNCSEDTTMAVTLDQDWIAVLREDDCVLPSCEELLERVIETYNIREEDGIVFLDRKSEAQDETSHGSPSLAILYSEETGPEAKLEEEIYIDEPPKDLYFLDNVLFAVDGDPNISKCASLLKSAYQMLQDVKVHKKKCRDLCDRSEKLLQELQGLETKAPDIVDDLNRIITQTCDKAKVWGSWSRMKSIVRQEEIQRDVETLSRGVDAALLKSSCLNTLRSKDSIDQAYQSSHCFAIHPGEDFVVVDNLDEQYRNPSFDWSRHLPSSVPLDRISHDRLLDRFFNLSTSGSLRIVPALFMRDMYRTLSVPDSIPCPQSHYSPMLHNALIALALAQVGEGSFTDPKTRQPFIDKAKSFIESECQKPCLSVVEALSILARLHNLQGELNVGYMYFGMSDRMSQALGLNNLDGAVSMRRATQFRPPTDNPGRRYEKQGSPNDLDEAISMYQGRLLLPPAPHPDRSMSLNNLAISYQPYYPERGGSSRDFSIHHGEPLHDRSGSGKPRFIGVDEPNRLVHPRQWTNETTFTPCVQVWGAYTRRKFCSPGLPRDQLGKDMSMPFVNIPFVDGDENLWVHTRSGDDPRSDYLAKTFSPRSWLLLSSRNIMDNCHSYGLNRARRRPEWINEIDVKLNSWKGHELEMSRESVWTSTISKGSEGGFLSESSSSGSTSTLASVLPLRQFIGGFADVHGGQTVPEAMPVGSLRAGDSALNPKCKKASVRGRLS